MRNASQDSRREHESSAEAQSPLEPFKGLVRRIQEKLSANPVVSVFYKRLLDYTEQLSRNEADFLGLVKAILSKVPENRELPNRTDVDPLFRQMENLLNRQIAMNPLPGDESISAEVFQKELSVIFDKTKASFEDAASQAIDAHYSGILNDLDFSFIEQHWAQCRNAEPFLNATREFWVGYDKAQESADFCSQMLKSKTSLQNLSNQFSKLRIEIEGDKVSEDWLYQSFQEKVRSLIELDRSYNALLELRLSGNKQVIRDFLLAFPDLPFSKEALDAFSKSPLIKKLLSSEVFRKKLSTAFANTRESFKNATNQTYAAHYLGLLNDVGPSFIEQHWDQFYNAESFLKAATEFLMGYDKAQRSRDFCSEMFKSKTSLQNLSNQFSKLRIVIEGDKISDDWLYEYFREKVDSLIQSDRSKDFSYDTLLELELPKNKEAIRHFLLEFPDLPFGEEVLDSFSKSPSVARIKDCIASSKVAHGVEDYFAKPLNDTHSRSSLYQALKSELAPMMAVCDPDKVVVLNALLNCDAASFNEEQISAISEFLNKPVDEKWRQTTAGKPSPNEELLLELEKKIFQSIDKKSANYVPVITASFKALVEELSRREAYANFMNGVMLHWDDLIKRSDFLALGEDFINFALSGGSADSLAGLIKRFDDCWSSECCRNPKTEHDESYLFHRFKILLQKKKDSCAALVASDRSLKSALTLVIHHYEGIVKYEPEKNGEGKENNEGIKRRTGNQALNIITNYFKSCDHIESNKFPVSGDSSELKNEAFKRAVDQLQVQAFELRLLDLSNLVGSRAPQNAKKAENEKAAEEVLEAVENTAEAVENTTEAVENTTEAVENTTEALENTSEPVADTVEIIALRERSQQRSETLRNMAERIGELVTNSRFLKLMNDWFARLERDGVDSPQKFDEFLEKQERDKEESPPREINKIDFSNMAAHLLKLRIKAPKTEADKQLIINGFEEKALALRGASYELYHSLGVNFSERLRVFQDHSSVFFRLAHIALLNWPKPGDQFSDQCRRVLDKFCLLMDLEALLKPFPSSDNSHQFKRDVMFIFADLAESLKRLGVDNAGSLLWSNPVDRINNNWDGLKDNEGFVQAAKLLIEAYFGHDCVGQNNVQSFLDYPRVKSLVAKLHGILSQRVVSDSNNKPDRDDYVERYFKERLNEALNVSGEQYPGLEVLSQFDKLASLHECLPFISASIKLFPSKVLTKDDAKKILSHELIQKLPIDFFGQLIGHLYEVARSDLDPSQFIQLNTLQLIRDNAAKLSEDRAGFNYVVSFLEAYQSRNPDLSMVDFLSQDHVAGLLEEMGLILNPSPKQAVPADSREPLLEDSRVEQPVQSKVSLPVIPNKLVTESPDSQSVSLDSMQESVKDIVAKALAEEGVPEDKRVQLNCIESGFDTINWIDLMGKSGFYAFAAKIQSWGRALFASSKNEKEEVVVRRLDFNNPSFLRLYYIVTTGQDFSLFKMRQFAVQKQLQALDQDSRESLVTELKDDHALTGEFLLTVIRAIGKNEEDTLLVKKAKVLDLLQWLLPEIDDAKELAKLVMLVQDVTNEKFADYAFLRQERDRFFSVAPADLPRYGKTNHWQQAIGLVKDRLQVLQTQAGALSKSDGAAYHDYYDLMRTTRHRYQLFGRSTRGRGLEAPDPILALPDNAPVASVDDAAVASGDAPAVASVDDGDIASGDAAAVASVDDAAVASVDDAAIASVDDGDIASGDAAAVASGDAADTASADALKPGF